MKKKLFILMSCFFMSLYMQAADGETFTANTPEGIAMTFKIISEANKTVQVGRGTPGFEGCAIDRYTSGPLTIPSKVTHSNAHYSVVSIGDYSLEYCDYLTSVTIPNNVTTIGIEAFQSCSSLTSMKIPDRITSIADFAFWGCKKLKSVTIPNSVKTIGNYAFAACSELTSITIPNNVTSIEDGAFHSCSDLVFVTIPNSVTTIGNSAFSGCSGLTSVIIPSSVTSIAKYAFSGCNGLTSINVESGNSVYDSRDNCNAIIETATNTLLRGCSKTIIPNSITSIDMDAFSGCSDLTSVTIPCNVTSIGKRAFQNCADLSSIIVKQANPIKIYSDVFSENIYQNCVLYVPMGRSSYYKSENGWSNFVHVEEMEMPDVEISKSPFANVRYNQMVLGHHEDRDEDRDEEPLFLSQGIYKFCIGYSKEQMKPFIGNKITYARFALVNTDISSVKLWISAARDADPLYTQNVSDIKTGWNEVKLEKAFDIQDDSVFIGIEYEQNSTNCPISYQYGAEKVLEGSFYLYYPNGKWVDFAAKERLCAHFQCLLEGDMIPLYDIHTTGIYLIKYPYYYYKYKPNCFYYKPNELITGYLQFTNWGKRLFDEYEIAYKLDDQEIGTSSNGYFSFTLPNLPTGIHTVTIYIKSINGEKPLYTDDDAQSILIKVYDKEMDRQKVYLESFTATWCPYTIGTLRDLKKLTELRDDISLVQLHSRDGLSCDAVDDYRVFYSGTPQLSSNRSVEVYSILEDIETVNNTPSFANVNISANYNHNNRELRIKVAGERNEEFIKLGEDVNLTVLLTEDNIINPQYDGENERYIYDYSHQGVLRTNVSNVWGDPIEWNDNKYENTYSILLDENWEANNMKIVAFLAKPFTGNNYDEISVMNCNDFAIKDANMDVPSYTLTYMVDGNTYKTYQVEYGVTITAEKEPTKEGCTFSGWSEIPTTMPAKDIIVTGYFTIIPPQIAGDVNGDGGVNVFDVTATVNYILGSSSDGVDSGATDVNGDGTVNVFDVTKLVNIILGVDDAGAKMRKAEGLSETDKLYLEDFEIEPGEEKEVNILLDNPNAEYRDLQFDLYLPEGISVVQDKDEEFLVDTGSRCTKKHTIGFSYTDGHYVCMLYSTAKNPLTGNSGDILAITLKADEGVTPGVKTGSFRNVSLSKTDATGPTYDEFSFGINVKGDADGIEDIIANDGTYQIYTVDGQSVNTLQKGVNIIRYPNGTAKKIFVK